MRKKGNGWVCATLKREGIELSEKRISNMEDKSAFNVFSADSLLKKKRKKATTGFVKECDNIAFGKDISIVIPVYNSEHCVIELNRQINSALKGLRYEIILVNDQSTDGSWEKIREVAQKDKKVIALNLRKNSGQDNAIIAGLSFTSGRYVAIMDDDLQHSPYDIPALYREIEKGYDVCYAKFPRKKQSWWKNAGSWLNGKIAEIVIVKPRHIYLSPFKIIRRDVVEEILRYRGTFPYVDGLIFQVSGNVAQIPVEHHERYVGKSNYSFVKSLVVFMKLVTGFSVKPLRIASLVGIATSLAGFLLGLYYIIDFFIDGKVREGWTTIVVLILFIGGLVLMSLGMIGEYVGRIYLILGGKPQYSIKEIVNGSYKKTV